jgi:predicted RNA binding protein YcfA (HicA-like mRNA interferase family)
VRMPDTRQAVALSGSGGVRLADWDRVARKYREVREALKGAGWQVLRQKGSHEVWGRPGEDARIVVAGKDSDTVPAGTLSSIRRASGLEQFR